jgi:hypothetical protein
MLAIAEHPLGWSVATTRKESTKTTLPLNLDDPFARFQGGFNAMPDLLEGFE